MSPFSPCRRRSAGRAGRKYAADGGRYRTPCHPGRTVAAGEGFETRIIRHERSSRIGDDLLIPQERFVTRPANGLISGERVDGSKAFLGQILNPTFTHIWAASLDRKPEKNAGTRSFLRNTLRHSFLRRRAHPADAHAARNRLGVVADDRFSRRFLSGLRSNEPEMCAGFEPVRRLIFAV